MSSTENLGKFPARKGSRKLKLSESVASSIGSNLNRIGGAQDLTKMLLTDDYFSDVNPRSMRRLMNVVYVTGELNLLLTSILWGNSIYLLLSIQFSLNDSMEPVAVFFIRNIIFFWKEWLHTKRLL